MTGLDTNILLRWLLSAGKAELPCVPPFRIGLVVLAEVVWVLRQSKKFSRAEIAAGLERMLITADLHLADEATVERALADFRDGSADFADYLLMRDNAADGCSTTLTLDKKAARHEGFTLVG